MTGEDTILPRIALTMGDPAGIGPEIVVRAATNPDLAKIARIIIYGCTDIIAAAAARFANRSPTSVIATGNLKFDSVRVGFENAECGLAAREAVVIATKDVLAGKADALVTAPMNKASVNLAGVPFTGHTELIAELCDCSNFAMMQSAENLRVAFVTTHIPLREVPDAISKSRIIDVAELLENAIRAEGIKSPAIAVAALNPHAGENGYMGSEENDIIEPALNILRERGIKIDGPFPPDTLFIEKTRARYHGILAMYHDQGHIPFKMLAFDRGVNSTLGLPIIRTSVDHGTAFNIAWRGTADTGSLESALRLATIRVRGRHEVFA